MKLGASVTRCVAAGVALVLSGCAATFEVPLDFTPAPNPDLAALAPRKLSVEVVDERPADERDLVAAKYLARWKLEKPAPELLADAIREGLESCGHSVVTGSPDVALRVSLTRFYSTNVDSGIHIIKRGELIGTATVSRGAGALAQIPLSAFYEREYRVGAPGPPTVPLQDVLDRSVNGLLQDPRLLDVMSEGAAGAQP